ncbi:MAG: hypothetical protein CMJ81_09545 [Planctomycetaceae bacterium]|nr:hypothetical protein [Planctomycetaceae bacterium]
MAPLQELSPHLYRFEDTCNVYVLRDGERALIVDCGSGAVVDHLADVGIRQVDWVLFTHHHRDQCFGAQRLGDHGAQLAVPHYERELFERATDYWQQKRIYDDYNDRNTFFTIGRNLPVARSLVDYDSFEWGPYKLLILATPGHTMGSISFLVEVDGQLVALTGDVMHNGGKLYQLHAMEHEYGDLTGANWVAHAIQSIKKRGPTVVLPSHGPVIDDPATCIDQLDARLHRLMKLMPDRMGQTFMHEIRMEQITPHLLWGTAETCSNFYVIKSDSGKAMLIDYPFASAGIFRQALHPEEPIGRLRFVEHHLDELREQWGINSFEVIVPTHIHDDHTCGIPYLQQHENTQVWALEDVAKVLEAPYQWNTPCLLETPIPIDRRFNDGDRFQWEGIQFEIVFYPGQTEFHSAILAELDDRRVIFSGDSSYPLKRYVPDSGDQWMVNSVLRNSLTFEMHRKCADEFERLRPDLLCPGHGPTYDVRPQDWKEHRLYIEQKEQIWRDLIPAPADLGIDVFWARLMPYQQTIAPGDSCSYALELRNSFEEPVTFTATLDTHDLPCRVSPDEQTVSLPPGAKQPVTFEVAVEPGAPTDPFRRHLLTATVAVNGRSHGPITEALLTFAH